MDWGTRESFISKGIQTLEDISKASNYGVEENIQGKVNNGNKCEEAPFLFLSIQEWKYLKI